MSEQREMSAAAQAEFDKIPERAAALGKFLDEHEPAGWFDRISNLDMGQAGECALAQLKGKSYGNACREYGIARYDEEAVELGLIIPRCMQPEQPEHRHHTEYYKRLTKAVQDEINSRRETYGDA